MAPEQIANESVDPRADLFSLGCVLYETCTGRRAFSGSSVAATLIAVTQQKPPSPRQVDRDVPKPLSDLVMKLLEKDPRRRCQTADEVLAALPECLASPQRASGGWKRGLTVAIGLAATFVLAVAATLISIKTEAGTLVLEVNQPKVGVTIDGQKIVIHTPRDRVEVRVGKHELDPRAGLLVTLGGEQDRLILRRVKLVDELEKSGADYLVVLSQPPPATVGASFSYRLDIHAKKGGVQVTLDSGPDELSVTPEGQVSWSVPANFEAPEVNVVVTLRDASGQEVFHTFTVRVSGSVGKSKKSP